MRAPVSVLRDSHVYRNFIAPHPHTVPDMLVEKTLSTAQWYAHKVACHNSC